MKKKPGDPPVHPSASSFIYLGLSGALIADQNDEVFERCRYKLVVISRAHRLIGAPTHRRNGAPEHRCIDAQAHRLNGENIFFSEADYIRRGIYQQRNNRRYKRVRERKFI